MICICIHRNCNLRAVTLPLPLQMSTKTMTDDFLRKGWGAIAKLLPLVDSFLLSTNKKAQFFTAPLIKTPLTPSPLISIISEALGVSRISDT